MKKRKFTWNFWDYDSNGASYVIAKDECPNIEDVPMYIIKNDGLSKSVLDKPDKDILTDEFLSVDEYLSVDSVKSGWCKFQCRSDWENIEGNHGWYVVVEDEYFNEYYSNGSKKCGWFPVWIVRAGVWY